MRHTVRQTAVIANIFVPLPDLLQLQSCFDQLQFQLTQFKKLVTIDRTLWINYLLTVVADSCSIDELQTKYHSIYKSSLTKAHLTSEKESLCRIPSICVNNVSRKLYSASCITWRTKRVSFRLLSNIFKIYSKLLRTRCQGNDQPTDLAQYPALIERL